MNFNWILILILIHNFSIVNSRALVSIPHHVFQCIHFKRLLLHLPGAFTMKWTKQTSSTLPKDALLWVPSRWWSLVGAQRKSWRWKHAVMRRWQLLTFSCYNNVLNFVGVVEVSNEKGKSHHEEISLVRLNEWIAFQGPKKDIELVLTIRKKFHHLVEKQLRKPGTLLTAVNYYCGLYIQHGINPIFIYRPKTRISKRLCWHWPRKTELLDCHRLMESDNGLVLLEGVFSLSLVKVRLLKILIGNLIWDWEKDLF